MALINAASDFPNFVAHSTGYDRRPFVFGLFNCINNIPPSHAHTMEPGVKISTLFFFAIKLILRHL
jgi:hypothetical protein